jgi:predicted GIY-YIG superfamily endonuclease
MWYVYILRSIKDPYKTYIGITENVERRLGEHNSNTQPHTKRYSPWRVETYVAFSDKDKAFVFEKYLKVGSGKAFLNKRLIGKGNM